MNFYRHPLLHWCAHVALVTTVIVVVGPVYCALAVANKLIDR